MPGRVERGDGVGDAAGAAVGDVIAGERHGVKAGARQRRDMCGIGARRRHVAAHLGGAPGVRHFEMADRDIGGAQCRGDSGEPVIGLRLIQHQISGEDEVEAAHASCRIHRDAVPLRARIAQTARCQISLVLPTN